MKKIHNSHRMGNWFFCVGHHSQDNRKMRGCEGCCFSEAIGSDGGHVHFDKDLEEECAWVEFSELDKR